jgi:oligoribonuclease NrnB/cAMP/cGMP phosphodiesterase (DHH superfamily)
MLCIYHRKDLDGHCSGAIVKYHCPHAELVGADYEDQIRIEHHTLWVNDRKIFLANHCYAMVCDFSLKPEHVQYLLNVAQFDVVCCDHHSTAYEDMKQFVSHHRFHFHSADSGPKSGCRLTYEYLHPGEDEIPYVVELVSDYDTWNHQNPEVLWFQRGMLLRETDPVNPEAMRLWDDLLSISQDHYMLEQILGEGEIVQQYIKQHNKTSAKTLVFPTTLHGHTVLAANMPFSGSHIFEGYEEPEIMSSFYYLPSGQWRVSLYSNNEAVHCGEIARYFGGGGGRGAAGFVTETLPFGT